MMNNLEPAVLVHNDYVRPAIAEMTGTAFYSFMTSFSVSAPALHLPYSLLDGLSLAISMMLVVEQSGAHLNPAISIAMFLTTRRRLLLTVCYCIAQFFGAFLGIILARALITANIYKELYLGNALIEVNGEPRISRLQAFFLEAFLHAILVITYLVLKDNVDSIHMVCVGTGMTKTVCAYISFPLFGQSAHSAVSLSSSITRSVFLNDPNILSFAYLTLLNGIVGILLGTVVYCTLLKPLSVDEPSAPHIIAIDSLSEQKTMKAIE